MASLDQVRIQYEAQVDQATKDLNKFNREQQKIDNQSKKNQKTFETTAQKREFLIQQEIKRTEKLKQARDKSFSPKEIGVFNERLKDSQNNLKLLRGETEKVGKSQSGFNKLLLRGAGLLAGAFAVQRIIAFGKQLFTTAKEMEAFQRRAKVVFGEASKAVEAFAKQNALSLGFTRNEFIGAAAAIGDILVPLGFTRDLAAEMSIEALRLGAALKEFTGDQREASEISNIVAKAFTGEVESLKGLGIVINQNNKDFKDLVATKKRDEGATDQQAKALAIYETVLASASDALNSYEQNTETLSRQSAELEANLRELSEEMAAALTPAFLDLTNGLLGLVQVLRSDQLGFFDKFLALIDPLSLALSLAEIEFNEFGSTLDDVFAGIKAVAEITEGSDVVFKEYANTIVGLKEKVKDYKTELEALDIDTDEFTIKQKQLTDAQKELAIALGRTTKKVKEQKTAFQKRLEAIRAEGAIASELRKAEEEEEADAAAFAATLGQERIDSFQELADEELEISKKTAEEQQKIQEAANVKFFESIEERRQAQVEAVQDIAAFSSEILGSLALISDGARDRRLQDIELEKQATEFAVESREITAKEGANILRELDEDIRGAQRRAANNAKQLALTEATVQGFAAGVRALGTPPVPNIPLAAATAGLVALQIGAIASQPIPAFAKGVTDTDKAQMALVGEHGREMLFLPEHSRVMKHSQTEQYKAELDAMQSGQYEQFIYKKHILPAQLAVEGYDDYGMRKITKQGNKQSVDNTDRIVNAIKGTTAADKLRKHRIHA